MKKLLLGLLFLNGFSSFAQNNLRIETANLKVDRSSARSLDVTLTAHSISEQKQLNLAVIVKPKLVFSMPVYNGYSEIYGYVKSSSYTQDWICKKFGYEKSMGVGGSHIDVKGDYPNYTPLFALMKDFNTGEEYIKIISNYHFSSTHGVTNSLDTVQCLMKD